MRERSSTLVGVLTMVLLTVLESREVAGDCGGTYLAPKGTIRIPSHRNEYPSNTACVYTIKASSDARIKFGCENLNLDRSVGCTKDWLLVNGLYACGNSELKEVYGVGELRVEFRSDGMVKTKPSFVCSYERVSGGNYEDPATPLEPATAMKPLTRVYCSSTVNAKYNYDEVLHKSLLFYEAQRSGRLPSSQRVKWRRDSATDDAKDDITGQRVDLEGGYYDAGDHVKFGYPMASAMSVLAWGGVEYGAAYNAAGEMYHLLAAVKWGTDYFIKAHVKSFELYGQVGKGDLDHSFWGRPEDMKMKRPAYKIKPSKPGADLAGGTAAALAAAAVLFQKTNPSYSSKCILHARDLYEFGKNYQGKYSKSITDADKFYKSYNTVYDELAWAAIWLYRATGHSYFLREAERHYSQINPGGISEFSWAEKSAGVMVLLSRLANSADRPKYKGHLKTFCERMTKGIPRTPKGLMYTRPWGPLRYAANAAFVCLQAADLGINTQEYRSFAKQQIHYMLGDAGRSYVVGFGHNPPQRPHHRASSCRAIPAPCGWSDFHSTAPNPQVLYGALVGGPDKYDKFIDDRKNVATNEVALDYNAGFQSAVAGLRYLATCH